jgi:transposase InsO family protein
VTPRTLSAWKRNAKQGFRPRKRGRKKKVTSLFEPLAIAREWRRQGCPGSRPIIAAMKNTRVRLIREVIREFKRRLRKRQANHTIKNRVSVKVKDPGTMLVLDAAKDPTRNGGECIVQRDRGSLQTEVTACEGKATSAADTLRVLHDLKAKNRLPLVAGSDNGSPFVAKSVREFYRANKVVHLRSLPRVPQQNGAAENGVGDFKRLVRAGATTNEACRILNERRLRETLHWKTPAEVDRERFQPCTEEMRERFYDAANVAIQGAKLGAKSAIEKRKAEREAIFQTMESFSLITRIRGHRRA